MNWAVIRPALKAAVISVTGLADGRVDWKGASTAAGWREFPRVDMSIRSVRGVGWDEELITYDDDPDVDANIITLSGPRQFTWTLRIESDAQSDASIAPNVADRIRVRLKRAAIADALRAAGVAVANVEPAQTVEFKQQDRMLSVVVLDVQMNGVENDIDTTDAGDYVKTTHVESKTPAGADGLYDTDGTPVANQVSITVESP